MKHLIDKSALVAEIENIRKHYIERDDFDNGWNFALDKVLSFIDTLEAKELLTWQDIMLISEIGENFMNSDESDNLSEEDYYQEILNRFRAQKEE